MNSIIYVAVSIPLILVLVGFNHAHGLTTFGKSNSQGQQNIPQPPAAQPKHCNHQSNCTIIKGTTCLKGYCLCGDNTHPVNGGCKAEFKGPRHLCLTDTECVDGADCQQPKDKPKPGAAPLTDKICLCQEGYIETGNMCGGGVKISFVPALILVLVTLVKYMD